MWKLFFEKYGSKCECCGEDNLAFLTIEHSDGPDRHKDGRRKSSTRTLQMIVRGEKRDDIKVLCFNCNCVKQRTGGICPHQGGYWNGKDLLDDR